MLHPSAEPVVPARPRACGERLRRWLRPLGAALLLAGCGGSTPPAATGPAGACPATPDDEELSLGCPREVVRSVEYEVRGTDLGVTVIEASMAEGRDASGRDTAFLTMRLRLELDGASTELPVTEGTPASWRGFTLRAQSLGFEWSGRIAGTLTVSR